MNTLSSARIAIACTGTLLLTAIASAATSNQLDAGSSSSSPAASGTMPATPSAPRILKYGPAFLSSQPRLIHWIAADLSDEARAAQYSGVCLIVLTVDKEGKPQNAHELRPIGMGLDTNAINAARQFRFASATYNGQSVPATITVEVIFKAQ